MCSVMWNARVASQLRVMTYKFSVLRKDARKKVPLTVIHVFVSCALCSVIVHSGSGVSSGHYFSYVRTAADEWLLMNDRVVTKVDLSEVLKVQAYILVYYRDHAREKRIRDLKDRSAFAIQKTWARSCFRAKITARALARRAAEAVAARRRLREAAEEARPRIADIDERSGQKQEAAKLGVALAFQGWWRRLGARQWLAVGSRRQRVCAGLAFLGIGFVIAAMLWLWLWNCSSPRTDLVYLATGSGGVPPERADYATKQPTGAVLEWGVLDLANLQFSNMSVGPMLASMNGDSVALETFGETNRILIGWKPPLSSNPRPPPVEECWRKSRESTVKGANAIATGEGYPLDRKLDNEKAHEVACTASATVTTADSGSSVVGGNGVSSKPANNDAVNMVVGVGEDADREGGGGGSGGSGEDQRRQNGNTSNDELTKKGKRKVAEEKNFWLSSWQEAEADETSLLYFIRYGEWA